MGITSIVTKGVTRVLEFALKTPARVACTMGLLSVPIWYDANKRRKKFEKMEEQVDFLYKYIQNQNYNNNRKVLPLRTETVQEYYKNGGSGIRYA
jgi:hypothetical protein